MTHDKAMQIGLNECASGLVPAPWIGEAFCDVLVGSRRQGEGMLMRGTLSSPEEALELGLVDAAVPLSRLSDEAQSRLRELLSMPNAARARAKARRLEAIRNPTPSFAFAFGATYRLTDAPPMPSMFAALGEVLADVLGHRNAKRRS